MRKSCCEPPGQNTTISPVPTTLTKADVERIAALAHLELSETETERFTRQLGEILTYFDLLEKIDTTGVTATTHPATSAPIMRSDEPRPSLSRDKAMANAPDSDSTGLFRVPKVIG